MPYIQDITEPLIKTLTYTSGLPVGRLAGHAANLGFWVGEVKHAFDVIDGYNERFRKLKAGERIGFDFHPFHPEEPVSPGIGGMELKELRYRLIDAVNQFLRRCYKEELVTEAALDQYCQKLDLDSFELKRKKKS